MRTIKCFDVNSTYGASIVTPLFIWPDQYERIMSFNVGTVSKLKEGDKVFFPNHIDYPRVKFRQWAEERGIAIAKFPKNANVTIVDTDVMDNILKSIKKVTIHKRAINAIDMPMVYSDYYESFTDQTIYWIGTLDGAYAASGRHYPKLEPDVSVELYMLYDPLVKDEKALEQFDLLINKYISSKEMNVISWSDFYTQVSSDLKLTPENFWNIHAMLCSEDHETRELGVEMMTNFDPSHSVFLFDLLFLLRNTTIRSSITYNKVTFKPLRNMLGNLYTDNSRYGNDYDYQSGYFLQNIFTYMVKWYKEHKLGHMIPSDFIKDLYRRILDKVETPAETIKWLPGLKVHSIIFDLNPEYFPNQVSNYLKDEQEEQTGGTSVGEVVHEFTEEDLSEYSNK